MKAGGKGAIPRYYLRRHDLFRPVLFLSCLIILASCGGREPVAFPVEGAVLYGTNSDAVAGKTDLSLGRELLYTFDPALYPAPFSSLELEYRFTGNTDLLNNEEDFTAAFSLVLRIKDGAWELPWDGGPFGAALTLRYPVPLGEIAGDIGSFSIALEAEGGGYAAKKPPLPKNGVFFEINRMTVGQSSFGFSHDPRGGVLLLSPFTAAGEDSYVIDVPPQYRFPNRELYVRRSASSSAGPLAAETGSLRFETLTEELRIPAAFIRFPLAVGGPDIDTALVVPVVDHRPFPEPLRMDPALVLSYPQESWRDSRFEVFAWEQFPSILILDTASYAVQDRLLKRLAFFTEKAGFRGRLAADSEIASLHGWNAHDYRAEDLARFFDLARLTEFPLNREERELEALLLLRGMIVRKDNSITAGEGALVSVSRESPEYLRVTFMAHEGFHGIFFVDEDFRSFCRRRWQDLSPTARRFILSYFDYQAYDIQDEYLVINEFMAHCLQQPSYQARKYFGQTLAARIDGSSWRRRVLPAKEGDAWPELGDAFERESEAFSAYVNRRWGLSGGMVRKVKITPR